MRGISLASFGGPEVLKVSTDIPKPSPGPNQVLVNVKAAGVNPVDTYIRSGGFPGFDKIPMTPGIDGAGIVDEVGEGVTRFKKGDRVWFCCLGNGAYAEYCVVPETNVNILPDTYSFEEASTIGIPYLTAHRALFLKANLQRGETVFIHGASGGVGTAAVQVCKSYGVRVVGTAGSEEGLKMLKEIGIDAAYNHRTKGYLDEVKKNEPEIDVILEMIANVNLQSDMELVSNKAGRIVVIGSRGNVEINPFVLMSGELLVSAVMLFKISPEELVVGSDFIYKGLKAGWVKPVMWKVMNLDEASVAHTEIMENKGAKGQIALKI